MAKGRLTRSPGRCRPGWPADAVVGEHRPPAGHEVVLVRVIQGPPAVPLVHGPVPGGLVLREPGPPALPVLPVSLLPLPLQVGRAGRRGHVVQGGTTAAPAAAGRARPARARPGPAARPTSPRRSAGPPGPPRRRGPRCRRAPGRRARPCRRGPGTPGASPRCGQLADDATGRYPRTGPGSGARSGRPGPSAAGHQVEQRVRLIRSSRRTRQHVRWLRHECKARFRRPNSIALDPETIAAWPRASSTRRTATAWPAPAPDPLRVLDRAVGRRHPLPDQSVLSSDRHIGAGGAWFTVASEP